MGAACDMCYSGVKARTLWISRSYCIYSVVMCPL